MLGVSDTARIARHPARSQIVEESTATARERVFFVVSMQTVEDVSNNGVGLWTARQLGPVSEVSQTGPAPYGGALAFSLPAQCLLDGGSIRSERFGTRQRLCPFGGTDSL